MRHGWFGRSWGAPICYDTPHYPTPVAEKCARCDELILATDDGFMVPLADKGTLSPLWYHRHCFLSRVLPHTRECVHCRGLEQKQHLADCAYRRGEGNCSCEKGRLESL